MLKIIFDEKTKQFMVKDQSTMDTLRNGHIGMREGQIMYLEPEEGLYLIDARSAECASTHGKAMTFNDTAKHFTKDGRFMARYFTYRDWRDRGLMIKRSQSATGDGKGQVKRYPSAHAKIKLPNLKGVFFPEDLLTIIDDKSKGKQIYDESWIGQFGTYKTGERGQLNKLDVYETVFLIDSGKLEVTNANKGDVEKAAGPEFPKLYDVYRDWREKGYVVKTGFKFGTHFRIYLPGAKPSNSGDDRTHSMHVVHVFPRETKLLISEWARAIRVAHSVRKTFILAIPGKGKEKSIDIDFVLYHRKGEKIELPEQDKPKYGMFSLSEDERIGGAELSAVLNESRKRKLELIVAIADRETAVTYYKVKRIELPGSDYEYYEIEWMQP